GWRRWAGEGGLVWTRVEQGQQITRPELDTFLERDVLEVAAGPRALLDRVGGGDAAGEFVPLAHGFDHDLSRADLGPRRRSSNVRAPLATGGENGGHHGRGKKRKSHAQQPAITRGVRHERLLRGQSVVGDMGLGWRV